MVVLVVDSSALIIERLQNILSETAAITNVYGAVSYKDAARLFNAVAVDVVLLDGNLPGNRTVDILTLVKKMNPNVSVIILADGISDYLETKYRLLGAKYFFDKYHQFEEIPSLINSLPKS